MSNKDNSPIDPDLEDFQCPITFEDYTPENYPITLPCGHTLSIQAFDQSWQSQKRCPVCRKSLSLDYVPQKNFLLAKILDQMRSHTLIHCSKHKEEKVVAICVKEKLYLCLDCVKDDKCCGSKVIPLEKFQIYLRNESMRLDAKENEVLQEIYSKIQVKNDLSSLVHPPLVNFAKIELLKKYYTQYSKQKQEFSELICGYMQSQDASGQIKVLNDIEAHENKLDGLRTAQEVEQRNLEANEIMKNKITALIEETPRIFIDNSFKEMNAIVDKVFCRGMELYFKEGFNNHGKFFKNLEKFQDLESLSLQNLIAFEDFGAADVKKLRLFCKRLTCLSIDFAGIKKNQNEASGLREFFMAMLKENIPLQTLQLSFKDSNFPSFEDLFQLHQLIESRKNLASLTLDFENCEQANEIFIKCLFLGISQISPKELNLSFLHCPHLTGDNLNELKTLFSSRKHLRVLALKLGHSQHISCSWLEFISPSLGNLQVSKLALHFEDCPEIKSGGFNHLISAIGQIKCLKELSLSFIGCRHLYDDLFFTNLKTLVKKLENLKFFSLCLKENSSDPTNWFVWVDPKNLKEFERKIMRESLVIELDF